MPQATVVQMARAIAEIHAQIEAAMVLRMEAETRYQHFFANRLEKVTAGDVQPDPRAYADHLINRASMERLTAELASLGCSLARAVDELQSLQPKAITE